MLSIEKMKELDERGDGSCYKCEKILPIERGDNFFWCDRDNEWLCWDCWKEKCIWCKNKCEDGYEDEK